MGGYGCYPPEMCVNKKNVPPLQNLLTGVVQGLYTATFPSFPPSFARLSLSLLSVPAPLVGARRTRSQFIIISLQSGSSL